MDKYTVVKFKAGDGIVEIPKKNIPFIPVAMVSAMQQIYTASKAGKKRPESIILPQGISIEHIKVVNGALDARPDTFKNYFEKLDQRDRSLLSESASWYISGTKRRLYSSDLMKRLLQVSLPTDIVEKIKSLMVDETKKEENHIVNFCLGKCIKTDIFLGLNTKKCFSGDLDSSLNWRATYFMGSSSHNLPLSQIPLPIEKAFYKTYGNAFFSHQYETRMTDGEKLKSQDMTQDLLDNFCYLDVIDHSTGKSVACQFIQHKDKIKGYCSIQRDQNLQYFVTYSDKDLIVSNIRRDDAGIFTINPRSLTVPGEMVHACFSEEGVLYILTYEGYTSCVYELNSNNLWEQINWYQFKEWGQADHLLPCNNSTFFSSDFEWHTGKHGLMVAFAVSNEVSAQIIYNETGAVQYYWLKFCNPNFHESHKHNICLMRAGDHIKGRRFLTWCVSDAPFKLPKPCEQEKTEGIWDKIVGAVEHYLSSQSDGECSRIYSPNGRFMMINRLIKNLGKLYMRTFITDLCSQEQITSIDTAYSDVMGVGFSHDSQDLLFFDRYKRSHKISLTCQKTEHCIRIFKQLACKDLGTMALISRLIQEMVSKKDLLLTESDPIRAMLKEWANNKENSSFKQFMKTCFPFGIH